jgi:DNA-binding NtrC family response regulator
MQKETRRVLIIDDDFDNLQLTKDVLQFNGFETFDFISPRLALDVFRQKPQSYNIIIIDIKMEEMDGRLVFKEIKQINPNAKILIFSGLELDVMNLETFVLHLTKSK